MKPTRAAVVCRVLTLLALASAGSPAAPAGAPSAAGSSALRSFNIPSSDASAALDRYLVQADTALVYVIEQVRGVTTNPVEGRFRPRDALERMMADTILFVETDPRSGALMIKRRPSAAHRPLEGAAPRRNLTTDSAQTQPARTSKASSMKQKHPLALLAAWATLLFPPATTVQQMNAATTGALPGEAATTLSGRVSNAGTQAYLEGALVVLAGTNRSTTTDREGRYHLNDLPSGPAKIVVSYTGLTTQEIPLTLSAGPGITRDVALTSDIYTMGRVVVAGVREGNAAAITLQRNAPNIKNIVSSDAFGNVADGNIGDFLQQLPGVAADYVGPDVRTVSIRGIPGELNTVTMDGGQIASSQSASGGRAFEFEQASLNLIETIELTKAPTPDMDAASVGGNVNLVSKSAFDRSVRRYANYSIGGVYRPKYFTRSSHWAKEPIANIGPSLNFTYADRLGAKQNIGVLLTGTHHSQPGGGPASVMGHQATLVEPYFINSINVPRPSSAPRTRTSAGAKVDYRHSEHTTFSLNTAYNFFHEHTDTRAMTLATTAAAANFRPGYTSRLMEILANNNSTSSLSVITADKSGATKIFSLSGRHRYPGWDIDYAAGWSISNTYYEASPDNRHYKSRPKASVALSLRNVGFIIDRTESLIWPKIAQTTGLDVYNLANYTGLLATQQDFSGEDEIGTLRLNVKRDFSFRFPTYVKLGGALKDQHRQLWGAQRRYNYIGPAGSHAMFLSTDGKYSDFNLNYQPPPWPSPFAIARHLVEAPEFWREDLPFAVTSRYSRERQIDETVSAAYAMGQTRFGQVSVLAGLRMEETRTDAEGPLQVNGVYTAERVRRTGSYRDYFPSFHVRYEPMSGLLVRASYSNGIGRPSFEDLMPLETVNETTMVINARNTALRPQYADNFDLSLEYYFEPVGSLTASIFQKEIKDFHFATTQVIDSSDSVYGSDYAGYTLTTRRNGGQARYRGFELGYQQMFTFLPGFWKGFGIYANYTHLDTKGDYGGATVTTLVPGMTPKLANFAITYLSGKFDVRVNAIWRDVGLRTLGANEASMLWNYARTGINLKSKYTFSSRTALFLDIENLTSEPMPAVFRGNKERPSTWTLNPPKIIAGVTGRF